MGAGRRTTRADRERGRGRRALSLVEVLLAGVLVAVTLLPLYDVFVQSERQQASSAERTRAAGYASALLEIVKSVPCEQLPLTSDDGAPAEGWPDSVVADHFVLPPGLEPDRLIDLGARFEPVTGRIEGFERTLSIRPVSRRGDGSGLGQLVRVDVRVRWRETMTRDRELSSLHLAYLHAPRPEAGP